MGNRNQETALVFLGTGAAWGLPELNCPCAICSDMRAKGERRRRTALLLQGQANLLVDCGPDILAQLEESGVSHLDAVLITHEHGDHYIGLDELFVFKRIKPREAFKPIPTYMSGQTWSVIKQRFGYLEELGVLEIRIVQPGEWFTCGPYHILPFNTDHGRFAKGSVGYLIHCRASEKKVTLLYTSDFMDIPDLHGDLIHPDYLIIQTFWLNEPVENRPHHMSFQRAIGFIEKFSPAIETFLVHMGDADKVPGDPANDLLKKYDPLDPLRPPGSDQPYPIPTNHSQWQLTVSSIMRDRGLNYRVTVALDGMKVSV